METIFYTIGAFALLIMFSSFFFAFLSSSRNYEKIKGVDLFRIFNTLALIGFFLLFVSIVIIIIHGLNSL